MKALELLYKYQQAEEFGNSYSMSERLEKAIKELEEYESDMDSYLDYTTGSRCTKSFNSSLGSIKIAYGKELEKIIKENSEDRLEELEKVILDYYMEKGYKFDLFGSRFQINISTFQNQKEIQILIKKDFNSNYETVFRIIHNTTKEMFDEAFEHFSIKE